MPSIYLKLPFIWSILLIKSDLKMCLLLSRSLFLNVSDRRWFATFKMFKNCVSIGINTQTISLRVFGISIYKKLSILMNTMVNRFVLYSDRLSEHQGVLCYLAIAPEVAQNHKQIQQYRLTEVDCCHYRKQVCTFSIWLNEYSSAINMLSK